MNSDPKSPPVDVEGFRSVLREAGVEEIVDSTLAIYVEQAQRTFEDLVAAKDRHDLEGVRTSAHSLKSASLNIRANELASLLQALETAASDGMAAEVASIFQAVEPAYESVIAQLRDQGEQ